jgi:hypothetical protein
MLLANEHAAWLCCSAVLGHPMIASAMFGSAMFGTTVQEVGGTCKTYCSTLADSHAAPPNPPMQSCTLKQRLRMQARLAELTVMRS